MLVQFLADKTAKPLGGFLPLKKTNIRSLELSAELLGAIVAIFTRVGVAAVIAVLHVPFLREQNFKKIT